MQSKIRSNAQRTRKISIIDMTRSIQHSELDQSSHKRKTLKGDEK